jgi:hypothetical protein
VQRLETVLNIQGLQLTNTTVVRTHAGSRSTRRYTVEVEGEKRCFFVKISAQDRSDVARLLHSFHSASSGENQVYQVPFPLWLGDQGRLLVFEKAPGIDARAALKAGQEGVGNATARWLCAFHERQLPLPMPYRWSHPLTKACRWASILATQSPELKKLSELLLDALENVGVVWPTTPHIVHGDFNLSHIFLLDDCTTVIDWDSWRIGDAEEDAGRFLASLHHAAIRTPAFQMHAERERRDFIRTFLIGDDGRGRQLQFYEAWACLQKSSRLGAHHEPSRKRAAALMLQAGLLALQQQDSGRLLDFDH